ncbi:hypothetical protein BDD12DRAFT_845820, partial [Trichophaea hybrida]
KPPRPMRRKPRLPASKPPRRHPPPNTFPDAADMLSNPDGQSVAAKNLVERIIELTPDKEKLWTSAVELIKLPFPALSILKPTDRFAFDTDRNWDYMPRRKFSELLYQVEALIELPDRASVIWLYGTIGYGKSHVLAALVCFLMKSALLSGKVTYLQDAMKLTDSRMETLPEITSFFQTIYRRQGVRKQTNITRVNTFGGMTKEELGFWWQRNNHVVLGGHSREQIEDMTGAVSLLLDGSIVKGRINLSSSALHEVGSLPI